MDFKKVGVAAVVVGILGISCACSAVAQEESAPVRRPRGERVARPEGRETREAGQWTPQQMQERMLDRIQETLQVSDQEWLVLKPRVEKVVVLSNQARMRRMAVARRPDADPAAETSPVGSATRELRAVLENQASTPADIGAKLTALRETRQRSQEELQTAVHALKELLTQRQEAQLVLLGVLE